MSTDLAANARLICTNSYKNNSEFGFNWNLTPNTSASDVDAAVDELAQNPEIGERKKGDLVALRVFKFRSAGQLFLLGHTWDEGVRLVYLEAVVPHENFYRDLKRQLETDPDSPMPVCPPRPARHAAHH